MYKDHEMPRFWLTYAEPLRNYLLKRVKDKSAVEDILHDVYVKIFCYCKRFDFCCDKAGVKNIRSWVFQVCHNTMVDNSRKNQKYNYNHNIEGLSNHVDPISCQDEKMMADLLSHLPEKYAVAVFYDAVLSLKQAEIAERLGLTLPATKSRIQRGKKMLLENYKAILQN